MDYPKSVPNVGLVSGKFVDENTATGQVGSLVPSAWGNSVTDELLAVIRGGGLEPDETDLAQLFKAVKRISLAQGATEAQAGVTQFATPAEVLAGALADKAVSAKALLATFLGSGGAANSDYIKIPFRDKTSGGRRELIIQWVRTTTMGTQGAPSNFPIAFPNACCGVWASSTNGASPTSISAGNPTTTTFASWSGILPASFGFIAIGY